MFLRSPDQKRLTWRAAELSCDVVRVRHESLTKQNRLDLPSFKSFPLFSTSHPAVDHEIAILYLVRVGCNEIVIVSLRLSVEFLVAVRVVLRDLDVGKPDCVQLENEVWVGVVRGEGLVVVATTERQLDSVRGSVQNEVNCRLGSAHTTRFTCFAAQDRDRHRFSTAFSHWSVLWELLSGKDSSTRTRLPSVARRRQIWSLRELGRADAQVEQQL
jgi:hypothetical protein